jgi:hypothetical protein
VCVARRGWSLIWHGQWRGDAWAGGPQPDGKDDELRLNKSRRTGPRGTVKWIGRVVYVSTRRSTENLCTYFEFLILDGICI